jgi:valyl-tRNA synthetase
VTEELWSRLKAVAGSQGLAFTPQGGWPAALIVAPWPEPRAQEGWEGEKLAQFGLVQELVRAIRNLRAEKQVKPGQQLPATFAAGEHLPILQGQAATLAALAGLDPDRLIIKPGLDGKPEGHSALVVGPVEVYLPLAGLVDLDEERARLQKDLAEVDAQIERLQALLAGPFIQKAPPAVVAKEQARLAAFQETAEKLRNQIASAT